MAWLAASQWQRDIVPVTASRLLDCTLRYTALHGARASIDPGLLVGDEDAARAAVMAPPRASERKVALDLALKALLKSKMLQ